MSKIKLINTGKTEILAVKVPGVRLIYRVHRQLFVMGISERDVLVKCKSIDRGDTRGFWVLPDGNWQLLGIATEIPESVWQGIVESGYSSIEYGVEPDDLTGFEKSIDPYGRSKWTKITDVFYKNYMEKPHHKAMCWTANLPKATESAMSFLEANELYSVNPYGERPSIVNHDVWYSEEQWQQAEANTGTWVILQRA